MKSELRDAALSALASQPVSQDIIEHFVRKVQSCYSIPLTSTKSDRSRTLALATFTESLIKRAHIQTSVIMVSLVYLSRLKARLTPGAKGIPSVGERIGLAAINLAWKCHHDSHYRNKSWAKYSGFSLAEVNIMEFQLLCLLEWDLQIHPENLYRDAEPLLIPILVQIISRCEDQQQQEQQQQVRLSQTCTQIQHGSVASASVMANRDIGHDHMPGAISTFYTAGSYDSMSAAIPGHCPDPSMSLSVLADTQYLPNPGYSEYNFIVENREQMQRRRQINKARRHQRIKLLSQGQDVMPSTTGLQSASPTARHMLNAVGTDLEESSTHTSPANPFTTQAVMQTSAYVTNRFHRTASYERNPPSRDDCRATYLFPTNDIASAADRQISPIPLVTVAVLPHMEPLLLKCHRNKPQCWDHGCNGREFSTFSNLLRHQREKSVSAVKAYCLRCKAEFTRTDARNRHVERSKCKSRRTNAARKSPAGSTESGS